jgi:hypothetical protein
MGAWGHELLQNDAAADAMGQIVDGIYDDVVANGRAKMPKQAGPLAAQLAVILRYSPRDFERRPGDYAYERTKALRAAIRANRRVLLEVAPAAGTLLDQLIARDVAGEHSYETLLAAKHARSYLQGLADMAVEQLETSMGTSLKAGAYLDLLVFIARYIEMPHETVHEWAHKLRESAADPDHPFLRPYLAGCKQLISLTANSN